MFLILSMGPQTSALTKLSFRINSDLLSLCLSHASDFDSSSEQPGGIWPYTELPL